MPEQTPSHSAAQVARTAQRFPDLDILLQAAPAGISDKDGSGIFLPHRPVHIARAPGRLDIMGGIADYSGSLVLQLPTACATFAAVQRTDSNLIVIRSLPEHATLPVRSFHMTVDQFWQWVADDYGTASAFFRQGSETAWAAYGIGVLLALAKQCNWRWEGGMRILIASSVPEGKGVSSSAAMEVAVVQAACQSLERQLDGTRLARICQIAENCVVGAPCGIMDQMTAALGRKDELLALLCQPADVQRFVPVPPEIGFWGIDSGIRHAVSGSDYVAVRTGAFMGYRIIADLAGFRVSSTDHPGVLQIEDTRWRGYLANLTVDEFRRLYAHRLPDTMQGAEFLTRYGGTTDPVTRVDPARSYAIRQPTIHPIAEERRVRRFAKLLSGVLCEASLMEMGQLMFDSHASYSECGLGADGTDRIVELVGEYGKQDGLFGAKITGGGSGGTVAVLGTVDAADAVVRVARRYHQETGHPELVFADSSEGAEQFPRLAVDPKMFGFQ